MPQLGIMGGRNGPTVSRSRPTLDTESMSSRDRAAISRHNKHDSFYSFHFYV